MGNEEPKWVINTFVICGLNNCCYGKFSLVEIVKNVFLSQIKIMRWDDTLITLYGHITKSAARRTRRLHGNANTGPHVDFDIYLKLLAAGCTASCSWWYLCYMLKPTCEQVLVLPSWRLVRLAADDDFVIVWTNCVIGEKKSLYLKKHNSYWIYYPQLNLFKTCQFLLLARASDLQQPLHF